MAIDVCHISGIFTVPVTGAWRVSFNLSSQVENGQQNLAWLYHNGRTLYETMHFTKSAGGRVLSVSGRVVTLWASAGDTIYLGNTDLEGYYGRAIFCVEFISKL